MPRQEVAYKVLDECEFATLSMIDKNMMPYAINISPVVINDDIYFHGGKHGKKIERA